MKEHFYDIESLSNVFTVCNFQPENDLIDCYHLVDTPTLYAQTQNPKFFDALLARILEKNQNFRGTIRIFDLKTEAGCRMLARTFGLSDAYMINDPSSASCYPSDFRLVCDTDPDYDEDVHPYLFGYNSYNYDTTMLAEFLYDVFPTNANGTRFYATTAKSMREFNDSLFTEQFKRQMPQRLTVTYDVRTGFATRPDYSDPRWRIRKNMLMTGRHLDVARLNEKQSKVGLKRLLGMLGHQILESDKLGTGVDHIDDLDQLLDLFAYNASDVVNLRELFHHRFYQGQFSLKHGLLKTYQELVYDRIPGQYKPDCRPSRVRRDRLTIDSSSAQFATKALCPYDHLPDIPTVSFMYPSERKCAELAAEGKPVRRVNVLEESRKFFYKHFSAYPDACAAFEKVYAYYRSIEGKNFNSSDFYLDDFGVNGELPPELTPYVLADMPKDENCMFYYNADGTPSSCFVTFSTGGIHGAEYNRELYLADTATWEKRMADLAAVQALYPDPLDLRHAKTVELDGTTRKWSEFLKSGFTIKRMTAMTADQRKQTCWRDVASDRPLLFKPCDNGTTALNKKYVYTSAILTNHEDFKSYYPNMLRMLSAFWNEGLGVDRYGEIFDDKERYGKLMKDKTKTEAERDFYSVKREGTKLVLNSASGAGDTNFKSPIQMNNRIISMRIIGQLFTWRIGQAQTLKGASIPSTNTDGLYSVMEEELNNLILAKESADIGVEIEPEPTYLISKDTNNRLEMDPDTGKILSASGGSLACRRDTDPTKALAHPAIIDWALAEYLVVAALGYKGLSISKPFDMDIGRNILASAKDKFEPAHLLRMFQNVLASSPGSVNYIFGLDDAAPDRPIIMQHYNRVFIVKDKTPSAIHLYAANAKVITPAMVTKRKREDERLQQHDPMALHVLSANGVRATDIPRTKEAVVKSVTNIRQEWYMLVNNRSTNRMTDAERQVILDAIDYDKYLLLLRNTYEENWRNILPERPDDEPEDAPAGDTSDTTDPISNGTDADPSGDTSDASDVSARKSTKTVDDTASDGVEYNEEGAPAPTYNVVLSDHGGNVVAEGEISDEKLVGAIEDAVHKQDASEN